MSKYASSCFFLLCSVLLGMLLPCRSKDAALFLREIYSTYFSKALGSGGFERILGSGPERSSKSPPNLNGSRAKSLEARFPRKVGGGVGR